MVVEKAAALIVPDRDVILVEATQVVLLCCTYEVLAVGAYMESTSSAGFRAIS